MLLDCGHEPTPNSGPGTGYGADSAGKTYCYKCCADRDREQMKADGQTMLYLTIFDPAKTHSTNKGTSVIAGELTNWPGTLRIPIHRISNSRHNWGLTRRDFWFKFEGLGWHGYQIGENTQIAHCRRLKQ